MVVDVIGTGLTTCWLQCNEDNLSLWTVMTMGVLLMVMKKMVMAVAVAVGVEDCGNDYEGSGGENEGDGDVGNGPVTRHLRVMLRPSSSLCRITTGVTPGGQASSPPPTDCTVRFWATPL